MSNCPNGAPPMVLQWKNYTVSADGVAKNRGIQIEVGTPPQLFSMRPSIGDNDLFLINMVNCAPAYNDSCEGQEGGVFNYNTSTSFVRTSEARWNGTDNTNDGDLSFIYFYDILRFGSNGTAFGYPFLMDQPGYGAQGGLPLGPQSKFLEVAVEVEAAPSTVYGLWAGSRSIDNPQDGALILGGYDTARVEGEPTIFPVLSSNCATCVSITGLSYEGPGGSTSLFSNSSESLIVALEPFSRSLSLPQDLFDNFMKASNGTWDPKEGEITYPASTPPTGSLSVTLSNGYKSIIPAEELFVYPRTYNNDGVYSIQNNTFFIAEVTNDTVPQYVANFGIPYLAMNYLIGDFARNQFRMAPAIRTDQSNGNGDSLQAICDPVTTTSTPSVPTSTPSTSMTPITTPSPVPPVPKKHTGAIIGGAVGGVFVLILIVGGLAFLFYRSRKRRNAAAASHDELSQRGPSDRMSQYTGTTRADYNEKEVPVVAKWLSSQTDERPMSPTLQGPLEMPAHN